MKKRKVSSSFFTMCISLLPTGVTHSEGLALQKDPNSGRPAKRVVALLVTQVSGIQATKRPLWVAIVVLAMLGLSCERKSPVVHPPILPYHVHHEPAVFTDSQGGKTVAYYNSMIQESGIYLCDFKQREPRLLLRSAGYGTSFSPDGRKIVFSDTRIWTINTNGDSLTLLFEDEMDEAFFPHWSPGGNRIAFDIAAGPRRGIYLMDSDGKNRQWLLHGRDPAWSPDGGKLYYTGWTDSIATDTTYIEIYSFEFATGEEKRLTFLRRPWLTSEASVSPCGERIAFTFQTEGGVLPQVWIMGKNGEDLRQVTTQGGSYPVFCSDEQIIYVNLTWGDGKLWKIGTDGDNDGPFFDESKAE
jgi:Tol biopolymer transport system component